MEYTNTTGKPISVNITTNVTNGFGRAHLRVDYQIVSWWQTVAGVSTEHGTVSGIVPSGSTYIATITDAAQSDGLWLELR